MPRKPRNLGHQTLINNAKKKKVSKSPFVNYTNTEAARNLIGMKKQKPK